MPGASGNSLCCSAAYVLERNLAFTVVQLHVRNARDDEIKKIAMIRRKMLEKKTTRRQLAQVPCQSEGDE